MKIELKFHHDTRFDYVQWRESLGSTNAERREWESILLIAMKERLEEFNGVPPEVKAEGAGIYSWQYSDDLRVQYRVVQRTKGKDWISRLKRWISRPAPVVFILGWERS